VEGAGCQIQTTLIMWQGEGMVFRVPCWCLLGLVYLQTYIIFPSFYDF